MRKKVLYIVDVAHGSGEVADAAIQTKVSVEAASANVRICSWNYDPRRVFAECGMARAKTALGTHYLSGKLQLDGHVPVPAPGPKTMKSRRLLSSLLTTPLKNLTMDKEGRLLIPDDRELERFCPVQLPAEASQRLAEWRAKYPRPKIEESAIGDPQPAGTAGTAGTSIPAGTTIPAGTAIPAGTVKQNKDEVSAIGHTIVKAISLPEGSPTSLKELQLVLANTASGCKRVWLHVSGTKDLVIPVGTMLGRGGNGTFVSLANETLPEDKKRFAWKYTRITSHKRDVAESANGYLLWANEGAIPRSNFTKHKPMCLSDIEQTLGNDVRLYGHSITRGQNQKRVTIVPSPTMVWWVAELSAIGDTDFDTNTLGQFCTTGDRMDSVGNKLEGLVRPIFEVQGQAHPAWGLNFLAPQGSKTSNALHLYTLKKIEIKAGQYMALHDM